MNPLPPVLGADIVPPPPVQVAAIPEKKFILCITKDLTEADLALFKPFNLVEYDDAIHKNLPIDSFDFDFLVIDFREKGDRYAFMKEVAPNRANYNIVVFCHAFEMDELEIDCDNQLSKLPERQARPEDFKALLLIKRVKKPRWYVSLFACLLNKYQKMKA